MIDFSDFLLKLGFSALDLQRLVWKDFVSPDFDQETLSDADTVSVKMTKNKHFDFTCSDFDIMS